MAKTQQNLRGTTLIFLPRLDKFLFSKSSSLSAEIPVTGPHAPWLNSQSACSVDTCTNVPNSMCESTGGESAGGGIGGGWKGAVAGGSKGAVAGAAGGGSDGGSKGAVACF